MKILVKFSNWGWGSFELSGFKIYDKNEWETLKNQFTADHEDQWYFSTNEYFEVEHDWLDSYTEHELSDNDCKYITDTFGEQYGQFCDLQKLLINEN